MLRPTVRALAGLACLSLSACYFDYGAKDDAAVSGPIDAGIADAAPPDAFQPIVVNFQFLSETGLYSDIGTKTLAPDVLEFEPEFKLWSDGAEKIRWIQFPPGTQIDTSDMDHWLFPPGTKVWKQFSNPANGLLETRFIMRLGPQPDQNFMATFVWDDLEGDAMRTINGAAIPNTPDGCPQAPTVDNPSPDCHFVPEEERCGNCHNGQDHQLLGFSAIQLSHGGPGVTLTTLAQMGLMSNPPPAGVTYPVPGTGVQREALGYIHANCGHCHNSDYGPSLPCFNLTGFQVRLYVADTLPGANLNDTAIFRTGVNQLLTHWTTPLTGNTYGLTRRIFGGDHTQSAIWKRMSTRDGWPEPHTQMPPSFTAQVDPTGVAAVAAWIDTLTPPPP